MLSVRKLRELCVKLSHTKVAMKHSPRTQKKKASKENAERVFENDRVVVIVPKDSPKGH